MWKKEDKLAVSKDSPFYGLYTPEDLNLDIPVKAVKPDTTQITVSMPGYKPIKPDVIDANAYGMEEFKMWSSNKIKPVGLDMASDGDFDFVMDAQSFIESHHGKYTYNDESGATGLAQFLPATWQFAKDQGWIPQDAKITDDKYQLIAQKRYMKYLYDKPFIVKVASSEKNRLLMALTSYVWGETKMLRAVRTAKANNEGPDGWVNHTPKSVMEYAETIYKNAIKNKSNEEYTLHYTWPKLKRGGILYFEQT